MRDTIDMAREVGLAPICEGCDVPDVSYAYESWDEELKAFEALVRADERALAAPAQEPVAWYDREMDSAYTESEIGGNNTDGLEPLYTTPPAQRQWVGLTDDEIIKCTPNWIGTLEDVARAIEAKLKEKNT